MRFVRWGLVTVVVATGLFVSARWSLQAQDRAGKASVRARAEATPRTSIQDALLRPLDLPFNEETTLEEVRRFLGQALAAQVVLDRPALDRLDLTPETTVQLDLKGVRLKVGLKLLLDQVGMAYHVEPEDNLLILTDPEASDDPDARTLAELKSIHRDLHDLQDAIDDLRDLVEEDLGIEPESPRQHTTVVGLGKAPPSPARRRGISPRPSGREGQGPRTIPRSSPGVRG